MHYVIISGSHRPENLAQSYKVSKWLAQEIEKTGKDTTDIISLSNNPYPLWDMRAWQEGSDLLELLSPALEKINKADALILVAPEYAGMVAPALKNFLLYVGSSHVAHKPCLLVGVSASINGVYPVAELRLSGYKNNRMVYIPDHLIVRDVEKVMNDHNINDECEREDLYIKKRALYSLDVLCAYTAALKDMRAKTQLLNDSYPNGM